MSEVGRRSGFLALPRDILDIESPTAWFPGDIKTAALYAYLVNRANWYDATSPLPRQKVTLKAGQLVIGLRPLAASLRGLFTVQSLRSHLGTLESSSKINTQKNTHGTIVTICNYAELFLNWPTAQHTGQHAANTRSTHGQHNHDTLTQGQSDTLVSPPAADRAPGGAKKKKKGSLSEESAIGRKVWSGLRDPDGRPVFVDWTLLDATMTEMKETFGLDVLRHVQKMADHEGHYAEWRQRFDRATVQRLCSQVADYLRKRSNGP